jgi:C_GCAxxG_C_C family probable redox protein
LSCINHNSLILYIHIPQSIKINYNGKKIDLVIRSSSWSNIIYKKRRTNLKTEQKIVNIRDRARRNFSKGFNCAECVLEAVLTNIDTGLPKEVQKVATGFGGGVGLYGDTCGAITGAVLAVGAVHGRSGLPKGEDRKDVIKKSSSEMYGNPGFYRLFNQIPNMIEQKYGNTLCREICDKWKSQWLCREHALHCREIITDAAEIAAKFICSSKEEIASKPFGKNVEDLKDNLADCDSKG